MRKITTFEDVFNRLIKSFQGKMIEIKTKQSGINISHFSTHIDNIVIKPTAKKTDNKSTNKKTGVISLQKKKGNHYTTVLNIPFILGFNTMQAYFTDNGALIKTLDLEFKIKKLSKKQRHPA